MNYLLGTGFYRPTPEAREWRKVWDRNLRRYIPEERLRTVVTVAVDNAHPYVGWPDEFPLGQIVVLPHNLGHVGDLLHGRHQHYLCGWSAAVIALAGLALTGGLDLLYREEDALCMGQDWDAAMYRELGPAQFIFGAAMKSPPYMQAGQSLFLIRHAFLPTFIRTYLSLGWDGDPEMLPENKFATIESRYRNECRRLSFAVDRERPLPYDAPVWSAQKYTAEELAELRKRGLLS